MDESFGLDDLKLRLDLALKPGADPQPSPVSASAKESVPGSTPTLDSENTARSQSPLAATVFDNKMDDHSSLAPTAETADVKVTDFHQLALDAWGSDDDTEFFTEPALKQVKKRVPFIPRPAPDTRTTLEKLRDWPPTGRLNGWLVTLSITLFAFITRLVNLNYPNKLVFDETYYAKDAWTLMQLGFEASWPEKVGETPINDAVAAGQVDTFTPDSPAFVVHPPLGKWLIGLGEQLFGMTSFGWRIMPCVFGALLILLTIRLARRLSRSTLVGAIAGLLLTFDGLTFVMSRIALLDIFQSVFLVAAVAACVADRDYYRTKIADKLEATGLPDFGGKFGPIIWLRPWRLLAGVMFGLSIAVKWNSMYLLAVMGVLCVIWDVKARRLAGAGAKAWWALLKDGIPAFIRMVVVAVPVYVASWAGWFLTSGGYDRNWGANNPDDPLTQTFGQTLASWINFHKGIYGFHTGDYMMNEASHPYESHPLSWLILLRPTAMDAINDIKPGQDGCPLGGDDCLRVVTSLATPAFWWLGVIAILVGAIWWSGDRDWRFGVPFLAMMGMYLPWFMYAGRPTFFFYSVTFVPYMAIALAMALGLLLGPPDGAKRRGRGLIVGLILTLVAANFTWIYPVLSDEVLPRWMWMLRMWFGNFWI